MEILLWAIAILLVAVGIAGLVIPVIPGPPLLFAGLFAAAWAGNFSHVGWVTLTLLGVMAVLAYAVDFLAGAFGAKRFGASPRAVLGAAIGAVAGIFFGIAGVLLGPFIGAVLGELSVRSDVRAAGMAGFGATLGLAMGAAAKLAIGFAMIGIFLIVRLF